MDEVSGFAADQKEAEELVSRERRLVHDARLVLCTSQYLLDRMTQRHGAGVAWRPVLVRNAISRDLLEDAANRFANDRLGQKDHSKTSSVYRVAYIGTVAKWLDLETLAHCTNLVKTVQFELIGPVLSRHRVAVDRLVYHDAVDHSRLRIQAEEFDAFIMPFVLNELTRGVDPVKLYEYLAFGKEVISVFYDELKRFAPFVHFYTSRDELVSILRSLIERRATRRNEPGRALSFLRENTWDSRVNDIKRAGLDAGIADLG
jgi:hypothetical protein